MSKFATAGLLSCAIMFIGCNVSASRDDLHRPAPDMIYGLHEPGFISLCADARISCGIFAERQGLFPGKSRDGVDKYTLTENAKGMTLDSFLDRLMKADESHGWKEDNGVVWISPLKPSPAVAAVLYQNPVDYSSKKHPVALSAILEEIVTKSGAKRPLVDSGEGIAFFRRRECLSKEIQTDIHSKGAAGALNSLARAAGPGYTWIIHFESRGDDVIVWPTMDCFPPRTLK